MALTFSRPRHATVVAYAALVIAMSGTAYAATGGTFLLGRANSESTTASLSNSGTTPALSLKSRAGHPALAISNSVVIPHLNADLVDGQRAGVVHVYTAAKETYQFNTATVPLGQSATLITKSLPAGTYWFAISGRVAISGAEDDTHCDAWFGTTWSGVGSAVEELPAAGLFTQGDIAATGVVTVPAHTPTTIKCSWANFQTPHQTPVVAVYDLNLSAIPVSRVN